MKIPCWKPLAENSGLGHVVDNNFETLYLHILVLDWFQTTVFEKIVIDWVEEFDVFQEKTLLTLYAPQEIPPPLPPNPLGPQAELVFAFFYSTLAKQK